jgi:5-methylcytosine-specific restriction endonuclease McrA
MPATTVDHVVPKVLGGTDEPHNLVAACLHCNSSRGGKVATR